MAVRDLKPKQIWEALHPEDKQVCQVGTPVSKHGHAQEKGFVAATAAATGQTERTTYRAIARADALGDEALAKVVPDSPTLDCNTSLVQLCQRQRQPRINRPWCDRSICKLIDAIKHKLHTNHT